MVLNRFKGTAAVCSLLAAAAVTAGASNASAAGSAPVTGTWSGKVATSGEGARFKVEKTRKGYRARSLRLAVGASCTSTDPNAAPTAQIIRNSDITVTLKKSGKRLVGVRNIEEIDRGGTEEYGIRMTFTSARRATVVISVLAAPSVEDENGNTETCKGKITVTAKPVSKGNS